MSSTERQIRRAAHAFPPRWRQHSGEELVATALASLPADAKRAPRRLLVDIVLAGWRERLRDRPPFGRWLLYILDFRLPARWRGWARDDINGTFYAPRACFRAIFVIWPLYVAAWVAIGLEWLFPLMQMAVLILLAPLYAERWRRKARRRNGLLEGMPGGDPSWPPVPTFGPLDRSR